MVVGDNGERESSTNKNKGGRTLLLYVAKKNWPLGESWASHA
jgi:hypothetical protein